MAYQNLKRTQCEVILGSRIWMARIGAKIGETNNTVSDTVIPELPESIENPGDWLSLGKISEATPQTDYKTADVEGVDDTGAYKVTELKLAQKRKIQFKSYDIVPEVFEMTFGLLNASNGADEQSVFASGNDSIECWLVLDLTDAYRTQTGLARITLRGKLSLQNPIAAKSDPAQAEYEFSVQPNALGKYTGDGLAEIFPA